MLQLPSVTLPPEDWGGFAGSVPTCAGVQHHALFHDSHIHPSLGGCTTTPRDSPALAAQGSAGAFLAPCTPTCDPTALGLHMAPGTSMSLHPCVPKDAPIVPCACGRKHFGFCSEQRKQIKQLPQNKSNNCLKPLRIWASLGNFNSKTTCS